MDNKDEPINLLKEKPMKIIDDYFDLMVCVIKADRLVRKEETALFLGMMKNMGMSSSIQSKYKKLLSSKKVVDSDAIISKVAKNTPISILPWFVRDAFLMADIDGEISKEEIQVIKQLVEKSGFTPKQYIKIKQWGLEYIKHSKAGLKLFGMN